MANAIRDYALTILQNLNEFRKTALLCDVILKLENMEIPAHRAILGAASKYFENMFKGKYFETDKEIITLEEMNLDAFKIILEYMYTGILSINTDNVGEILKLSDYLQLKDAKQECCKFLECSLTSENAIEIWDLARTNFCDELQYKGNEAILANLESILNTEKFLKLDFNKIEEIFKHDKILVTPADLVFTAIIEWIKYDLPSRQSTFNALSKYVKVESISKKLLNSDIFKEKFLRENLCILNWIADNCTSFGTFWSVCEKCTVDNSPSNDEDIDLSNHSLSSNIFISSLKNDLTCFKYETKSNERSVLSRPSLSSYYPVFYKKNIYLTGGLRNNKITEICPKYDTETGTWSEMKFDSQRISTGTCVINDYMFIVGGRFYWDSMGQTSVTMYDFETGRSFLLNSKMSEGRQEFGIAVRNQSIYACGGLTKHSVKLNTVERLDHREGKWELSTPMNGLSGVCTSAIVSHTLYCATREGDIVRSFDIRRNSWEEMPNLPTQGNNCLVESGGNLFAVTAFKILKLNKSKNCWEEICTKPLFSLDETIIAASF